MFWFDWNAKNTATNYLLLAYFVFGFYQNDSNCNENQGKEKISYIQFIKLKFKPFNILIDFIGTILICKVY